MSEEEFKIVYGTKIPKHKWDEYQAELEVFKKERQAIWHILNGMSVVDGLDILLMTAIECVRYATRDEGDEKLPMFLQSRAGEEAITLQRMLHDVLIESAGSEGSVVLLQLSFLHNRIKRRQRSNKSKEEVN